VSATDSLTAPQAAEFIGVSIVTLRRWDEAGILPSEREGKQKHRHYSREDLVAFVGRAALPSSLTGVHTFVFDFDSTLFPLETLEELLRISLAQDPLRREKCAEIEEIGRQGMEGLIPIAQSMALRLACANVHRSHIEQFVQEAKMQVSPKVLRCLAVLRERKQKILVLSNGFRECILPLTTLMGIEPIDVFCGRFLFAGDGTVLRPCRSPLLGAHGKADTVHLLRDNGFAPGTVFMIGDGMSDLDVVQQGAADHFIGCGFFRRRASVQEQAPHFCSTIGALQSTLRSLFP